MQKLFARIERGLTMEIRVHDPTEAPDSSDQGKEALEISELRTISQVLQFPVMHGQPVLQLPQPDDSDNSSTIEPEMGR